ncbi:MAG: helix-turn-helix transcriptional regulator [Chloroflexota bacterium]|nr:helix-turn-helix transcriptional regulator [Chloroflexota bacterium]
MPIQRPLTPRQHVILRNVALGKTNKDIAAELGISEQGVKVHISRLLERYGAQNRVELVSLTRAWPEPDERGLADLSSDVAGIRVGLNRTYQDATAFGEMHGTDRNGHRVAAVPAASNGHASKTSDLVAEVRALREVLGEINVALKLARELPADATVGPLVDAIRSRVGAALEQSARLDALVDRERARDRGSRQSAS